MPYAPDIRCKCAGRSGEFRENAPCIGIKNDTTLIRRQKVSFGRKNALFLLSQWHFDLHTFISA